MANIKPINVDAPGEARDILSGVKKQLGMIPNILATMAQSPVALKGYLGFSGALAGGKLTPDLREQIALAVAGTHQCDYCASAHTLMAKGAGVSAEEAALNLTGSANDPKTNAVLQFVRDVVDSRGHPKADALETLRNIGLSDGEITEILAHIGVNIFTNYFNHIAGTEVDFPLVKTTALAAAE